EQHHRPVRDRPFRQVEALHELLLATRGGPASGGRSMARTVVPASSFCAPTLTTRLPAARPVTCTQASSMLTTCTGLKTRPEPLASSTQTPADPLAFTSAVTGKTVAAGPTSGPDRF